MSPLQSSEDRTAQLVTLTCQSSALQRYQCNPARKFLLSPHTDTTSAQPLNFLGRGPPNRAARIDALDGHEGCTILIMLIPASSSGREMQDRKQHHDEGLGKHAPSLQEAPPALARAAIRRRDPGMRRSSAWMLATEWWPKSSRGLVLPQAGQACGAILE